MNNYNGIRPFAFLTTLALALQSGIAAAEVAQSPLFVSAGAEPNVMLLIDNSGSMDNMIWDSSYDPNKTYNHWGNRSGGVGSSYTRDDGNVHYSALSRGTCSSGYIQGRRSNGTTKCLKLPTPRGSSTRYTGNYLNFLFDTFASGTDLTQDQIPTEYRMQVAKEVATKLVNNTTGVRFGLAAFNAPTNRNSGPGGSILAACGSTPSSVISEISKLSASANTPLAETYYEITRYFRGLSRYQGSGSGDYTSPIQYRCQKSFVVVITDGLPTYDRTFPSNDPDDPESKLPNWDGIAAAVGQPYSDGSNTGGDGEGDTLYLDDLAKFGYDIDLRKGGNDNAGKSFNDAKFSKQNLITHTVGFATANQMLEDAAEYGHGSYYIADDAGELTQALTKAVSEILAASTSAAAVATNSTRLSGDTRIYQARFNTLNWTGQLLSYPLDKKDGSVLPPDRDAADKIPAAANRKIFTWRPAAEDSPAQGIEFLWDNLSDTQKSNLNPGDDGLGEQRLAYLRGDQTLEGTTFRERESLLGDIVNSNPVFAGDANFGFNVLPGQEGSSYRDFVRSNSDRSKMIYVGANDGMLHAFDAESLVERFAYVPNTVFPNLHYLTRPDYDHRYYVDGSPRISDAYLSNRWRTVLTGTLGAGGRGIFALDVTDPTSFSADDVLWEFPPNPAGAPPSYDADLGIVLGQAVIARLNTGHWVAMFGNGPGSQNKKAVLFIVDLETGELLATLDTKFGGNNAPNGLGTPVPVDLNGDRITDVVYAGDLQGNLWKFTLPSNKNHWGFAFESGNTPQPLFRAVDAGGKAQPITMRPAVTKHPNGGYMIYFGTGKYFETGDKVVSAANDARNSFYAIHDTGSRVSSRSDLRRQAITFEGPVKFTSDEGEVSYDVRKVSNHALSNNHKGWYLDLIWPDNYSNGYQGERVVSEPVLHAGRIIFTTLIPTVDPCSFGGNSWLMELNAFTGGALPYAVFDVDGDGVLDAYSGIKFDQIVSPPEILEDEDPDSDREYKYQSGTSGEILVTIEKADSTDGRLSWRQIR